VKKETIMSPIVGQATLYRDRERRRWMGAWVERGYSPGTLKNLTATFSDCGEFHFIFVCSSCSAAKRFDFSSPL
jgi:hypothetical protein